MDWVFREKYLLVWSARIVVFAAFLDLFIQFSTASNFALQLGADSFMIALIVGIYSGTNLFGNLVSGYMLDKFGRKTPVAIGLGFTAVSLIGYSLVTNPEQLLVIRSFHGLVASVLAPGCYSIIGDETSFNKQGKAMGITGSIIALAAIIGPASAGYLSQISNLTIVYLMDAAILITALIVFCIFNLNSQTKDKQNDKTSMRQENVAKSQIQPVEVLENKTITNTNTDIIISYLSILALTIGVGVLVTEIPVLLETQNVEPGKSGLAFSIYALVAFFVMLSPLNRLVDKRFAPLILLSGLIFICFSMFLNYQTQQYTGVMVSMAIFGFGYGLISPASSALLSRSTNSGNRGLGFGFYYAIYSVGVLVGSFSSGLITDLEIFNIVGYLVILMILLIILTQIKTLLIQFKKDQ
tara:strand:+ start:664 stop:1896 length:1233 start_codon:yes stop_codon:yes gene_type:complete